MTTPAVGPVKTPEQPPVLSPERIATVEAARAVWIRKLIDLSRRNNLLFYRPLKTGVLDLSTANPEHMANLLSGQSVSLSKLLGERRDEEQVESVRSIGRRSLMNLEERGLSTLFVVLGMATWAVSAWPGDSGRPVDAPVLLLPVKLETTGGQRSFSLVRTGTVQLNLVLLHVLEAQFGLRVRDEDLIPHLLGDDEGEPFNPTPLYQELLEMCKEVPEFDVRACAVLGNFAFQKMAMVRDLQERGAALAAHDVVAAIAGDKKSRAEVAAAVHDMDPRELDRIPPANEFLILDADSSQQCAINGVLAGESAVVHGPPGTGKSQTIANLIASLAAEGKKVLFVAEKRAALEVVLRRLQDCGLGHLTIDLHGADVSSRKVMDQVARTLELIRTSTPVDGDSIHERLADRRSRLNSHVTTMHAKREPAGRSAYELEGLLLRMGQAATCDTRWRGTELQKITPAVAQHVRDALTEAAGFATLFLRTDPSPWTGAQLRDGATVQKALDLVAKLATIDGTNFQQSLASVLASTSLHTAVNLEDVEALFTLVGQVQTTLGNYSHEVFSRDVNALVAALQRGRRGGLAAVWAFIASTDFRQAKRTALALRREKAGVAELYAELRIVAEQTRAWGARGDSGARPVAVPDWKRHEENVAYLVANVRELERLLARKLPALPLAELTSVIERLYQDNRTPHTLPKLCEIEQKLESEGAMPLIAEIRKKGVAASTWVRMFEYSWLASTLDAACAADPEILGFRGATHNAYVDEFHRYDEERIELAAARVRRAHAERAVQAMNQFPQQQLLLRAEAHKSRKHLPLRRLFAEAADVLTAVSPCWMASPLSVSQLLDGGKRYFDVVVFDEASQVLPEDAVPAVMRGSRLVVAGDNQQLPPTTFFASAEDDDLEGDNEPAATEGYESLLDMMNSFLRSRYLQWHYRSRDEALIDFSNHHIYSDRLVTFPGTGGPTAVSHVLVHEELGRDGQEESSSAEVRKVVELILQHAQTRPEETLGVIAMGIKHAERLQAALDQAVENNRELDGFFDTSKSERFFIKNLERVQGDERDAIILSIGYGKDRAGNLPFRFGPLLAEGGRRRLNVAVTRSRQRLTLVSSFSHLDMDLARVRKGSGVELLRNYLQYASTGGKRLGDAQITGFPVNSFEAEVNDVLSGRGLKLIPQMGASSYRIDLVAEHPKKPGRYVLAIECDGASYHSAYTARDRDRLRQQQLEKLGWRFHRIWSTDWFMRKQEEVERAIAAFEAAVAYADRLDAGTTANHAIQNHESHLAEAAAASKRGPKPNIGLKPSIAQYSTRELVQLVKWVGSDGQLRTDDQIIEELVPILGFSRRGARIEATIKRAIEQAKLQE